MYVLSLSILWLMIIRQAMLDFWFPESKTLQDRILNNRYSLVLYQPSIFVFYIPWFDCSLPKPKFKVLKSHIDMVITGANCLIFQWLWLEIDASEILVEYISFKVHLPSVDSGNNLHILFSIPHTGNKFREMKKLKLLHDCAEV